MAENMYLRIMEDEAMWLLLDDESGVVRLRGEGDLATFAELTRNISWSGQTRVLLPAEQVLLTTATIPAKQRRQMLAAIPYVVEESLATDVEHCHFAAGARQGAETGIAVIEQERLRHLLDRLDQVGIVPSSVTPDVLHLPLAGTVTILVDGPRALLRQSSTRGLGQELSLLPVSTSLLGAETQQLVVYVHPSEQQSTQLYLSQVEASFAGEVEVVALEETPFEFLCRSFDVQAIDLLQGKFSIVGHEAERRSGWRAVGVVAAVAFVLQVGLLLAEGIYLNVKAGQYGKEAGELYAEVFPADRDVRDMRRRWQAHLGGGHGNARGEFLTLFGDVSRHLGSSNLILENVNFNESRGDLILQLVGPGSEQFVAFAQTLGGGGIGAEVGAISQDGGSARGSIKIRMAGR